MFSDGQIVYFRPFYFKNGNTAKNKYFIIVKNIKNETIIASLPTRGEKAPALTTIEHGCINIDERCFNCYLFQAGKVICDNGFAFDQSTYVYGNEVEDYDVKILESVYLIENVDYEIAGTLIQSEYQALLSCLKESASVKRKIKKLL